MYDINFPASNVSTHIKNFTPFILYGVSIQNEYFRVIPEDTEYVSSTIYVMSQEKVPGQMMANIFSKRYYKAPEDNLPLYIPEMGCVLFISDKERADSINTYGNGKKLVQSFAAGIVPLINATYVTITCLSEKKYYHIPGGVIEEIPRENSEFINRMMVEYDIPQNKMLTHDVFLITTIIRKNSGNFAKDTTSRCKIEYIDKSKIIPGNPIIFSYNGLIIFDEYNHAESFLSKYGSVENYMIAIGLAATKQKHEKEIEEFNKKATNDKKGMVQLFTLMGGTSICSIFTEQLIKCAKEGTDGAETFKRLIKIVGIGLIGIGGILGIYFLYKKYTKYKEDNKKKS
jgi:hypothetical protein